MVTMNDDQVQNASISVVTTTAHGLVLANAMAREAQPLVVDVDAV
jgi:adenine/guanine phosphoribosyltransferase-like PRPP-binding protein